MPKRDKLSVLKSVPLFEGLAKTNLRSIAREMQEEVYSPGQTIVKKGDPGGRFFVVLEGRAKVVVGNRTRAKLGPGDFFGEMSVIDRAPRSASVVAETHITGLSLASWNLLATLEENWPITKKVLVALSERVRDLENDVTH